MGLFLLHTAAVLGLGALGIVVGRCRRRVWLPVALGATALALLRAGLRWRPDLAAALFPWINYPLVQNWHVPMCLLGLTALIGQLPRRQTRRVVGAAVGVIAAYGLWSAGATFLVSFDDLTGRPDASGFCRQTSSYSCGAAALATWLAHLGVESTEREVARLSATQWHGGVTALGMWRAARLKLRGRPYKVRLRRISWDDVCGLDQPCVVVVRYSLLVDHFVVVVAVDGDLVTVADPLAHGIGVWSRRELESRWRRLAIVVDGASGDVPPA